MPLPTLSEIEEKYFIPAYGGPRYSGNVEVIPHIDGEAYFNAIADAIDRCTGPDDKIYIASWVFSPTFNLRSLEDPSKPASGGATLGTLLVDKAHLQVDVRIILGAPYFSAGREGVTPAEYEWWIKARLDNIGVEWVTQNNIREARKLRSATRGGVKPLEGRVLLDWGGSTGDSRHEKTTIVYIDSTKELRAFVGGIDYTEGRISSPLHDSVAGVTAGDSWHDIGVELYGSAAEGVVENFITRWVEADTLPATLYKLDDTTELYNHLTITSLPTKPGNPVHPAPLSRPDGETSVCVLRSYEATKAALLLTGKFENWRTLPAAKITEILDVLKQAINSASRYIYVEDQTLNPAPLEVSAGYNKHDELYPAISAACARGVKVIFVCWDGMTGSVGPSVSSQIVEKILDPLTAVQRQNFALYWLAGNRLHSKLVIVDDEFASIGAANFWDRSMQGTESELNAAYVCTAGSNSQVASLRVKLWSEHLRLTPAVAVSVEAELRNLDKSLGIFRTAWATSSLSFSSPGSVLREIVS